MPESSAKYAHKPITQMESVWSGSYFRARGDLGVTAFGLGVMQLPAGFDEAPAHVHTFDGQEELYLPLKGDGEIEIGDRRIAIDQETAVRVGPAAARRLIPGPEGIQVLIAGGTPGQAYEPFEPLELGAPDPQLADLPGIKAFAEAESNPSTFDNDDFTAMRLDELGEKVGRNDGISFYPIGRGVGVTAFGLAVIDLEDRAGESKYPLHDHEQDGQTEVYVVQRGSGWIVLGDERKQLSEGEMIAVEPELPRQLIAGESGMRVIAIGAPTGSAYVPRKGR